MEQYLEFLNASFSEQEERFGPDVEEIERHIQKCDACASKFQSFSLFDSTLKNWTVQKDNFIFLHSPQLHLQHELEQAAEMDPSLRPRLLEWMEKWKESSLGAMKIFLKVPVNARRKVTKIFVDGISSLQKQMHGWEAQNPPLAMAGGLRSGEGGENAEVGIDFSIAKLSSPDHTHEILLNIDPENQKLIANMIGFAESETPPLLLLVPKIQGEKPVLKKPQYSPEEKKWKLDFSDMQPGEYWILFEPVEL